jgi:hypothetical protein
MSGRNVPPIGTQCNAWGTVVQTSAGSTMTAAATGANGFSSIVNTFNAPFVSAFGHVDGATTINLQYSADGVNFATAHIVSPSGAADFDIDCICGGQYVRLQSTNGVNATATIQSKSGGSG